MKNGVFKKDKLIDRINDAAGDKDLLLDFMNQYNLNSLYEATEEQLSQYIADNRL